MREGDCDGLPEVHILVLEVVTCPLQWNCPLQWRSLGPSHRIFVIQCTFEWAADPGQRSTRCCLWRQSFPSGVSAGGIVRSPYRAHNGVGRYCVSAVETGRNRTAASRRCRTQLNLGSRTPRGAFAKVDRLIDFLGNICIVGRGVVHHASIWCIIKSLNPSQS